MEQRKVPKEKALKERKDSVLRLAKEAAAPAFDSPKQEDQDEIEKEQMNEYYEMRPRDPSLHW